MTAKLLEKIAISTTDTVVLNREDPRIAAIAGSLSGQQAVYFGLAPELRSLFPSDDDMRAGSKKTRTTINADVILKAIQNNTAQFVMDGNMRTVGLELQGVYNIYNAAAALALVRAIVGESLNHEKLLESLSQITPAFGRGETVTIGGQPLELLAGAGVERQGDEVVDHLHGAETPQLAPQGDPRRGRLAR